MNAGKDITVHCVKILHARGNHVGTMRRVLSTITPFVVFNVIVPNSIMTLSIDMTENCVKMVSTEETFFVLLFKTLFKDASPISKRFNGGAGLYCTYVKKQ